MLRRALSQSRAIQKLSTAAHRRALTASAPPPVTHDGEPAQRTFIALKHDALQRGLCGEILARFERRGLKPIALKLLQPTRALAEAHYAEHREREFFERVCVFLSSGPVVACVLEGRGVISAARKMLGPTETLDAPPGTIRGDYGVHWRRNLCHASDSEESAAREIALWFREEELAPWDQTNAPWLYELPSSKIKFGE